VRLAHLDRLAALGSLVAEIIHEVRNPLVSIETFLELLPKHRDDPSFAEGFRAVALGELRRIERLIEALLAYARPDRTGDPEPDAACDASDAAFAVARLAGERAAASGVALEMELPTALPPCGIAADALRQVLLNLALNALDVTPNGGDVRIAARVRGTAVEIDVEDRGPGIPPALRTRVFEPFFSTRTDRPGGLGLSIARRLVEEAGGTLVVGDRSGGGARFRVRLPARR
jgi:signal transduction histidine kinase